MDQRRVVAFLALSVLVLILFGPKQKRPEKDDIDKNLPPVAEATEDAPAAEPEQENDENPPVEDKPAEDQPADEEPEVEHGLEYVTLGSVDEDSPYRVLVTLTSQGAGVRRVELASSKYRDLHDRGGYLGHLEVIADPSGGVLVQSVGAGTPAAKAGLKAGDRILSANSNGESISVDSPKKLSELLARHKPRESIALQISQDDAQPTEVNIDLGRRPLEIIRPESENVEMRSEELPAIFPEPPSFRFALEKIGSARMQELSAQDIEDIGLEHLKDLAEKEIDGAELRDANWEISSQDETGVTFRKRLPKHSLIVLKRYSLEPIPADQQKNQEYPAYGLQLDVEIQNTGKEDFEIAYRLDGPNGLPTESWWFANKISREWGAGGLRDVIAKYEGSSTAQFSPTDIIKDPPDPLQSTASLDYIGIDAQYFSALMQPVKDSEEDPWIDEARMVLLSPKPKSPVEYRLSNVTCRLVSHPQIVPAGKSLQHSYKIFTGPKRPELLTQYSLDDVLYYGWFGGVAKIMLSVLHFFYGFTSNYGIAIILLTVLVRSCMFPISRKQAQSMAKMQELKPEMDKLKEKYKNDMQKQSQAMQEIYRKHNINPLAGCLPMFLQLPIFLGLYRALMVDVELRQEPLLSDAIHWCSNLAAPDMLFDWSGFMPSMITTGYGIMVLGPYLNILPLVTVSLFMLQQKLFMPEPANEQAAMQQKIMKYMMLFMGLMFFKVASGLCLYFIASSIWGIAERKLLPKPTTPEGGTAEAIESPRRSGPSSNGSAKKSRPKKKPKKKR